MRIEHRTCQCGSNFLVILEGVGGTGTEVLCPMCDVNNGVRPPAPHHRMTIKAQEERECETA